MTKKQREELALQQAKLRLLDQGVPAQYVFGYAPGVIPEELDRTKLANVLKDEAQTRNTNQQYIQNLEEQPIYKLSTGATFRMDANGGLKELMAVRPPQQAPQYQTPFATPAQRQNVQAQPVDMITGSQQPICTTDINGRKVCR